MLLIVTFLSHLIALTLSANYTCPANEPCIINCANSTETNISCADSLIDGAFATNLTVLCPTTNSCLNMNTTCPFSNSSRCDIICSDSFSCDGVIINSKSPITTLNCISSDINHEDICTNDVRLNIEGNNINEVTINCILNTTNTSPLEPVDVTICNNMTITTNTNTSISGIGGNLQFNCKGNGIKCDGIDIESTNMDSLYIVTDGYKGNLMNSSFINNNKMNVDIIGGSLISQSIFSDGINNNNYYMNNKSNIKIMINHGSKSSENEFIFNGINSFEILNPDLNESTIHSYSALINNNKIIINNSNLSMFSMMNINGDGTNNLTVPTTNLFKLICTNNANNCGHVGTIDITQNEKAIFLIGNDVHFDNIIKAHDVISFNMTVLSKGILNGVNIDATNVNQFILNIFGKTSKTNIISASEVKDKLHILCNNPKSCSDDLIIYASPGKTDINCISTACDMMTLYVSNTIDNDISFNMSQCDCYNERNTLCITEWNIYCGEGITQSILQNGECSGECCGDIIDDLQETFDNKYQCPLSNETMYICQTDTKCIVDCSKPEQFGKSVPFICSSSNSSNINNMIDASMANSLEINCGEENKGCSNLNILCPKFKNTAYNYCNLNCNDNGLCSNLQINTLQNSDINVLCMNGSCNNITIEQEEVMNGSNIMGSNSITVQCIDANLCGDIEINTDEIAANIAFNCDSNICNDIHIDNKKGSNMINIHGTKTKMMSSIICGNTTNINGNGINNILEDSIINGLLSKDLILLNATQSFEFVNNIIALNHDDAIFNVLGDGTVKFINNTINDENSSFILSINNGGNHDKMNGIKFNKIKQKYIFQNADSINITITNIGYFNNNWIEIINPSSIVNIYNFGEFLNNTINGSNSISIKCIEAKLCEDINININETGYISFDCYNNICNDIHIDNKKGSNMININGTKTKMVSSIISGNIININGNGIGNIFENNIIDGLSSNDIIEMKGTQSFIFRNNIIATNDDNDDTMFYVLGDGTVKFLNNSMYGNNDDSSFILSINNGENHDEMNGINFNKTRKEYIFGDADYINITIINNNKFIDNLIEIINPSSNVYIYNFGEFYDNIIDAEHVNSFNLFCNAYCYDNNDKNNTSINHLLVSNVKNLTFTVALNDEINDKNTKIDAANVENIKFVANKNGKISDIYINPNNTNNIELICKQNGELKNFTISSLGKINSINIENNEGIIDKLIILDDNDINKIFVNITGTLSNSIINGLRSNNLSVICSNVISANCQNVTLYTPTIPNKSSLLCQNEGCKDLIFYTKNNIDDINISLIDCPCKYAVETSCILKEWDIYCDSGKSILANNKCNGECCGNIINHLKISNCDYNGGNNKKNKTGAIVGGICGGILLLVIIGGAFYYFKKKKKAEDEALLVND